MLVKHIYLGGGMMNLSQEEQEQWRNDFTKRIESAETTYKPIVCNPCTYFSYINPSHQSEKQIARFDLHKVRNTDVLVMNFNDFRSLGSMAELAIAYDRLLPVVGINEDNIELHGWQIEFCDVIFDSVEKAADYVIEYHLS